MPANIRRIAIAVGAAMAVIAVGGTVAAQTMQRFSDVPPDHEAFDAIEWAAEVGVTTGYEDGTFKPEQPLSKRHALVFMERYYDQILQADESDGFTRGDMMILLKDINDAATHTSGQTSSVIDPDQRSSDIPTACDSLRRTAAYIYPGAPVERLDVTVVSVGFDPPGFFEDLPVPEFRINEVLAAVETQIEEISHGRTDVVFHRHDDVIMSGRPGDYASSQSFLGHTSRVGIVPEVRSVHPDATNLLVFTTSTHEHPTTSFYADHTAVIAVEGPRTDPLNPDTRFYWARKAATHELLHMLGLGDLYATGHRDPSNAGGEWSLMGLRAYGGGNGVAGSPLTETGDPLSHEPMTGWNKWLLGWLDGPEVVCVSPAYATTVVVRPHQQATYNPWQLYVDHHPAGTPGADCWSWHRHHWGEAAPDPAIAIIPTSATTALVVEADPFAGQGLANVDRCGPIELPERRTTRSIGDVLVYAVDITVPSGARPQRMVNPITALVAPAEYQRLVETHSPTGSIGHWYTPEAGWPADGIPVDAYYTTEVTAHGYRISVDERITTDDGYPEVTVTIEPV